MKKLIEYTKQFLIENGLLIIGCALGFLLGQLIIKFWFNTGIFFSR